MPRHAELAANSALGDAIRAALPSCDVRSENTRQIVDSPNLRPDILIAARGRSPAVIDARNSCPLAPPKAKRARGSAWKSAEPARAS